MTCRLQQAAFHDLIWSRDLEPIFVHNPDRLSRMFCFSLMSCDDQIRIYASRLEEPTRCEIKNFLKKLFMLEFLRVPVGHTATVPMLRPTLSGK